MKPGGILILTGLFGSNVHIALYHFRSGLSKYSYKNHFDLRGFEIDSLIATGDW